MKHFRNTVTVTEKTGVDQTIFSNTFEINGSTEIGRKLFRTEESSEGFLSIGVKVATLKAAGTEPVQRHLSKRDTNPGPTASTINQKNLGCMESKEQKDDLVLTIVSLSSCREIGSKASQEA